MSSSWSSSSWKIKASLILCVHSKQIRCLQVPATLQLVIVSNLNFRRFKPVVKQAVLTNSSQIPLFLLYIVGFYFTSSFFLDYADFFLQQILLFLTIEPLHYCFCFIHLGSLKDGGVESKLTKKRIKALEVNIPKQYPCLLNCFQ